MVSSAATSVKQYLSELPADRRKVVKAVRAVIKANLPPGYREGMQYGMIGWYIPLSRYPNTYNGQPLSLAALASQKQYVSLYLMSIYADPALSSWFQRAWSASGAKLNMGKSCVRFKSLEEVPLEVVGEAIGRVSVEQYLARYEKVKGSGGGRRRASKKKRS